MFAATSSNSSTVISSTSYVDMENMSLIVTLNSSCHVWIMFSADAYVYKSGSVVIRALIEGTPVDSGEV